MDNRPIGLFDSGVGGLSAVRVLRQAAPGESICYFGDTARVPYGDRTPEDIRNLSRQDARFLRSRDVKAIVIACNTITANALPELTADSPGIPVIGVIQPAAEEAVRVSPSGRIGIIATNATVQSGVYTAAIQALRPDAVVTAQGCPKLVPLIETGHTAPTDELLMPVLREYLAPLMAADVDTVILGCTHYPLIAKAAAAILGEDVALVDSGAACIGAVMTALRERDALADPEHPKTEEFFCSARIGDFTAVAEAFLGTDIRPLTREIDIEAY